MTVKTLTSRDFQKNIGSTLDLVSTGETVRITRYGRGKYFIIPENGETEELLRRMAGNKLIKNLQTATTSEFAKTLSPDDITKLIDECFS